MIGLKQMQLSHEGLSLLQWTGIMDVKHKMLSEMFILSGDFSPFSYCVQIMKAISVNGIFISIGCVS